MRRVPGVRRFVCGGLVLGALVIAGAGAATPAVHAEDLRPDLTTCFWTIAAGGTPATNRLVTDINEVAWAGWVVLPRSGTLRLRHTFPHARSVAWSVYDPFKFAAIDTMRDHEIVPDAGSANPFVGGADRTAPNRSYTVTVSAARRPTDGGAPNTLYTNGNPVVGLFYRVYVPDQGRDRTGDADLPEPVYRPFRWGPTLTGGRACRALNGGRAATGALNQVLWNSTTVGLTLPYLALLALKPESSTFPALAEGKWDVFFNFTRLTEPFMRGTSLASQIGGLPTNREGPASDWAADTATAFNYVDRRLGPNPDGHNLLVLRGSMPRTPHTVAGDPAMNGDVDMRYWSLCQMTAIPLGVTGPCLYDEQVPVGADGRYTIVMGAPEDRPADATEACGVGWLDWGTAGDGYGRRTAGTLTLRNQDPSPGFGHAIQDVAEPGQEEAVMGEYLPTQEYVAPEDFRAPGCGAQGAAPAG